MDGGVTADGEVGEGGGGVGEVFAGEDEAEVFGAEVCAEDEEGAEGGDGCCRGNGEWDGCFC